MSSFFYLLFSLGLAFSHDGTRIAVSQSDGVAHVYSLEGEGKRSICCRLPLGCIGTSIAWAPEGRRLLFIGLSNGKVKVADVEANKLATLHDAHRLDRGFRV